MRFIKFFADVPHLMKTVTKCVFHSRSGRRNKIHVVAILWSHIACIYNGDLESVLKLVNKLTSDQINFTS